MPPPERSVWLEAVSPDAAGVMQDRKYLDADPVRLRSRSGEVADVSAPSPTVYRPGSTRLVIGTFERGSRRTFHGRASVARRPGGQEGGVGGLGRVGRGR